MNQIVKTGKASLQLKAATPTGAWPKPWSVYLFLIRKKCPEQEEFADKVLLLSEAHHSLNNKHSKVTHCDPEAHLTSTWLCSFVSLSLDENNAKPQKAQGGSTKWRFFFCICPFFAAALCIAQTPKTTRRRHNRATKQAAA